jgi:hypothetical protein
MTDLAQPVANETAEHQPALNAPLPGTLPLPGSLPVTVYVKYYRASPNTEIAGFGAHQHGPFYGGGITWPTTPDGEYAKFITFDFPPEVSEITCEGLFYSVPFSAHPTKQDLCIVPLVGGTSMSYNFTVRFKSGNKHDPQIIVTPITVTP